jgi:hypothetical protein
MRRFALLLSLCLTVLCFPATADDGESGDPLFEPAAVDVLKRMSAYLSSAKTLSFTGHTFYDVIDEAGIKIKNGLVAEISIERPNKMHSRVVTDEGQGRELTFDGKKLSLLVDRGDSQAYQTIEADVQLDEVLDRLQDRFRINFPAIDLLYSDLMVVFKEHLLSVVYLGEREVAGKMCHHLSLESVGADWQLWVEVGDQPVPRRLVINYITLPGEPEYFTALHHWRIDGESDQTSFTFVPPPGASKAQILTGETPDS